MLRFPLILLAVSAALWGLIWMLNAANPSSRNPVPVLEVVVIIFLPLEGMFAGARAYRSLPIAPIRLTGALCIIPVLASTVLAADFLLETRGFADVAGLAGVVLGTFGCFSVTAAFWLGWGGQEGFLCFIVLGFGLPMLFGTSHGADPGMRSAWYGLYLGLAAASAALGPWLLHRVLTRRGEPYRMRRGGRA